MSSMLRNIRRSRNFSALSTHGVDAQYPLRAALRRLSQQRLGEIGEHLIARRGALRARHLLIAAGTMASIAGIAIVGGRLMPGAMATLSQYWALIGVTIFAVVMLGGAFVLSVFSGPDTYNYRNGDRYIGWYDTGAFDGCDDGD